MGYSQRKAADELGMTLAGYQQMERGVYWSSGKPIKIDKRTDLACSAIRHKIHPESEKK